MNYRKTKIMGALEYLSQARLYLATNQPKLADQVIKYALEDLHVALDIGPSKAAIEEIVGKEEAA